MAARRIHILLHDHVHVLPFLLILRPRLTRRAWLHGTRRRLALTRALTSLAPRTRGLLKRLRPRLAALVQRAHVRFPLSLPLGLGSCRMLRTLFLQDDPWLEMPRVGAGRSASEMAALCACTCLVILRANIASIFS